VLGTCQPYCCLASLSGRNVPGDGLARSGSRLRKAITTKLGLTHRPVQGNRSANALVCAAVNGVIREL